MPIKYPINQNEPAKHESLGLLLSRWGALEGVLQEVFESLLRPIGCADRIWLGSKSFRYQSFLLSAALSTEATSEQNTEGMALIKRTDALYLHRNRVVHANWVDLEDGENPFRMPFPDSSEVISNVMIAEMRRSPQDQKILSRSVYDEQRMRSLAHEIGTLVEDWIAFTEGLEPTKIVFQRGE